MTYAIHIHIHPDKQQTMVFKDPFTRARFLKREKDAAKSMGMPHTYRAGEYLRVYKGPITYWECDIRAPKPNLSEFFACDNR